jgi:hypothetical protein
VALDAARNTAEVATEEVNRAAAVMPRSAKRRGAWVIARWIEA